MRNLKRRAQVDGPRTRICAQQPRGIWTNGGELWKTNLKTAANLPAFCRNYICPPLPRGGYPLRGFLLAKERTNTARNAQKTHY